MSSYYRSSSPSTMYRPIRHDNGNGFHPGPAAPGDSSPPPAAAPPNFDLFGSFSPDSFRKFSTSGSDNFEFNDGGLANFVQPTSSESLSQHPALPPQPHQSNVIDISRSAPPPPPPPQNLALPDHAQPYPQAHSAYIHQSPSMPALNPTFRYDPAIDLPHPALPPSFSSHGHFRGPSSPSPTVHHNQHAENSPHSHPHPRPHPQTRSRSRSRPPSNSNNTVAIVTSNGITTGGIGPTRTFRTRRINSVSNTSPPPGHNRTHSLVVSRSRAATVSHAGPGVSNANVSSHCPPWYITGGGHGHGRHPTDPSDFPLSPDSLGSPHMSASSPTTVATRLSPNGQGPTGPGISAGPASSAGGGSSFSPFAQSESGTGAHLPPVSSLNNQSHGLGHPSPPSFGLHNLPHNNSVPGGHGSHAILNIHTPVHPSGPPQQQLLPPSGLPLTPGRVSVVGLVSPLPPPMQVPMSIASASLNGSGSHQRAYSYPHSHPHSQTQTHPPPPTLALPVPGPAQAAANPTVPGPSLTMSIAEKQALLADEKRRKRRESHNAVERRRRDNINERIGELAMLIPECLLEGIGVGGGHGFGAETANGGAGPAIATSSLASPTLESRDSKTLNGSSLHTFGFSGNENVAIGTTTARQPHSSSSPGSTSPPAMLPALAPASSSSPGSAAECGSSTSMSISLDRDDRVDHEEQQRCSPSLSSLTTGLSATAQDGDEGTFAAPGSPHGLGSVGLTNLNVVHGENILNGSCSGSGGPGKANKGMILRKSVEYIRYLQQLVEMQGARNRQLEAELRAWKGDDGPTGTVVTSIEHSAQDVISHSAYGVPSVLASGRTGAGLGIVGFVGHGASIQVVGGGDNGVNLNRKDSFFGLPSMPEGDSEPQAVVGKHEDVELDEDLVLACDDEDMDVVVGEDGEVLPVPVSLDTSERSGNHGQSILRGPFGENKRGPKMSLRLNHCASGLGPFATTPLSLGTREDTLAHVHAVSGRVSSSPVKEEERAMTCQWAAPTTVATNLSGAASAGAVGIGGRERRLDMYAL